MDKQTYGQTDIWTERQMDRQTDRQTERQNNAKIQLRSLTE